MSKAFRRYQRHIHAQLDRLGTWLPGDALSLGDIGTLSGGSFRKETDLRQLGIAFAPEIGPLRSTLSCSSVKEISLELDGSAEYSGASARGHLDLLKVGSVLFEARDVEHRRIADQADVNRAILRRHAVDRWLRDWVLIDQVWTAGRATVLVSLKDRGRVDIEGKGEIPTEFDRLVAAANLALHARPGEFVGEVDAKGITPLFTARKVNWRGSRVVTRSSRSAEPSGELEPVHLDDLLGSIDHPTSARS